MKRIIIIVLALLCAIALVACKQEPEEPQKTEKTVKLTSCTDISADEFTAGNDSEKYELNMDYGHETHPVTLKVWTKDAMTGQWPENPRTYTGTWSYPEIDFGTYSKVLTETESYIERIGLQTFTLTFTNVDDPAYSSMVNVYGGSFDITPVSGWFEKSTGRFRCVTGSVSKFEVPLNPNLDENAVFSPLIGVGNWTAK